MKKIIYSQLFPNGDKVRKPEERGVVLCNNAWRQKQFIGKEID